MFVSVKCFPASVYWDLTKCRILTTAVDLSVAIPPFFKRTVQNENQMQKFKKMNYVISLMVWTYCVSTYFTLLLYTVTCLFSTLMYDYDDALWWYYYVKKFQTAQHFHLHHQYATHTIEESSYVRHFRWSVFLGRLTLRRHLIMLVSYTDIKLCVTDPRSLTPICMEAIGKRTKNITINLEFNIFKYPA